MSVKQNNNFNWKWNSIENVIMLNSKIKEKKRKKDLAQSAVK